MILPILIDHRMEDRRMVGCVRDTKDGLHVSMQEGQAITEDQLAATFGMAGVTILLATADESGNRLVQEFLIKEFSLCAASQGRLS